MEKGMPRKLTKDTLFKPARSRLETKADITDRTVRTILDEEVAKRRAKTAKLRAARLEMESQEAWRRPDDPGWFEIACNRNQSECGADSFTGPVDRVVPMSTPQTECGMDHTTSQSIILADQNFATPDHKDTSVRILVRDNNVDQALRVLKKKLQREGVFREMKAKRAYEKPSEKRSREKAEAIRRSRKAARKMAQREGLLPARKRKTQLSKSRSGDWTLGTKFR
jgi:small subunit ribosomal protein S21